jgi:hypothetical protein
MAAPSAYDFAKMFTQLVGRDVKFVHTPRPPLSTAPVVYGIYGSPAQSTSILVKAELKLMGSLGGLLVGLPDSVVQSRVTERPLDELLQDAIHEILNVTASPLSTEARAVLETMHLAEADLPEPAQHLLQSPAPTTSFLVSVAGYSGGMFHVKTQPKKSNR